MGTETLSAYREARERQNKEPDIRGGLLNGAEAGVLAARAGNSASVTVCVTVFRGREPSPGPAELPSNAYRIHTEHIMNLFSVDPEDRAKTKR